MPQTLTERVTKLERFADVFNSRLDATEKEIEKIDNTLAEAVRHFADMKREVEREAALLKREVNDLNSWREEVKRGGEEFGRRLWMIVPPILAAVVSSALTGLITYLIRR